jgi:TonB family protein
MKRRSLFAVITLTYLAGAGFAAAASDAEKTSKPVRWDESTMAEPKLVHKVAPKYPKEAKEEGVEGTVVLEATIAKDGTVTKTRVKKEADPRLTKAAREAVEKWRYEPVRDADGTIHEVLFTVTIRFALR